MARCIEMFARINKANNQINFQLKKSSVPKNMKPKLSKIKSLKVDLEDFEFF